MLTFQVLFLFLNNNLKIIKILCSFELVFFLGWGFPPNNHIYHINKTLPLLFLFCFMMFCFFVGFFN